MFVSDDSGNDAMRTPARHGSYKTAAADIVVLVLELYADSTIEISAVPKYKDSCGHFLLVRS